MSDEPVKSIFLGHIWHAYAPAGGGYKWPNSREGDMLRQAKKEIGQLESNLAYQKKLVLADKVAYLWTDMRSKPTRTDIIAWAETRVKEKERKAQAGRRA